MSETRDKIVAAAVAMVLAESGVRPSVRAVATRAGVGASTLRHYFPTQQALLDVVLQSIFETRLPDERLHDRAVPAVDRLVECMQNFLAPLGDVERARDFYRQLFRALLDAETGERTATAYELMDKQGRQRIADWLTALEEQGELAPGDHSGQVAFLLTVLDGLAVGRALPVGGPAAAEETGILRTAAEHVLSCRPSC